MNQKVKSILIPIACFIVGNILLVSAGYYHIQNEYKSTYKQALSDAEKNGQRVQMIFENASNMTEMFGYQIRAIENHEIVESEVNQIISDYYDIYQNTISSVLYAPNGNVQYVYPDINSDSWNINLFENAEDAIFSRDTGALLIAGPISLQNGNEGMMIFDPVYRIDRLVGSDNFLGFAAVTIDLDYMVDNPSVLSLKEDGYRYLLIKEDMNNRTIAHPKITIGNHLLTLEDELDKTASYTFNVSNYHFTLYVIPETGWIDETKDIIAFGFVELVLFLITALVNATFSIRNKSEQLKMLSETDQLTGLRNRTSLREHFPEMIGQKVTAVMTDIDYFKKYNDTYGHEMGDTVLKRISEIMRKYVSDTFQIYRFGGDEFLIWDTCGNEESTIEKVELMMHEIDQIHIKGCDFPIHMTYGAAYGVPTNDEELRNLRNIADEKLYVKKQNRPK